MPLPQAQGGAFARTVEPGGRTTTELAADALARGRAALVAADMETAAKWLDRACRLAPTDRSLTLTLAAACLAADPRRAASLFARVAEIDDVREAWLGLAAAQLRLDDEPGAADALAQALHRHTPARSLTAVAPSLADEVVRAAAAPGWCGLTGDGELVIRKQEDGPLSVRLDGRDCNGQRLPRGWEQARQLTICLGRRELLGSPVDIAALRRCAGFVQMQDGGLRGWAWHPGDPDRVADLIIRQGNGRRTLQIIPDLPVDDLSWTGALARPRGFIVPAEMLAEMPGLLHVLGPDGRDLTGSPLDPGWEQRSAAAAAGIVARLYPARPGPAPRAPQISPPAMPADVAGRRSAPEPSHRQDQPPDIVIPVYGNAQAVAECLESAVATVPPSSRIVVVDDASPHPEIATLLERFRRTGRVEVLRQPRNGGFPTAANAGIAACAGRDVVLLNSDAWMPPQWLERLRAAAYSAPDIGTATPFSNQASILSYPGAADRNLEPSMAEAIALDRCAQAANAGAVVEIPVGVGFCLYIRRDCLDDVGLLRADMFAQGYGEENDFCLRARHLGWRHVAVPGLFVRHTGGGSFGAAGRHLQLRNDKLLNRLHPGYSALIEDFIARDPLADARRRLDLQRWQAARRRRQSAAILVTHDAGGGVERQIAAAAEAHRAAGRRPVVLRPVTLPDGSQAIQFGDDDPQAFPNLCYRLPDEQAELLRLLRAEQPKAVEVHHLLGHPPAILDLLAQLGVPYTVHVHDYAWFCPRVALVGGERRYCGEPAVPRCEACIADNGALTGEDIGVQALRDRSNRFLSAAKRVVAPSEDAASRMRRHFPSLRPMVVPHQDDSAVADPPPAAVRNGRCHVVVLGAIGLHKGYDVLLACARDAAERRLPLEFAVVGHTIDDARLLATGRVFITGRYEAEEAVPLIVAQRASLALLPSIWPETWNLGLTELWRAGLRVAAFDFGAPAERIRRTGRGYILPLGLPSHAINNVLVAASGLTVHEGA